MKLTIYGQSDDNFELRGFIDEELSCYDSTCTVEITVFERGLRVTMLAGQWLAKIEPLNEPDEAFRISYTVTPPTGNGRSDRVDVDVPENAVVRVFIDDEIVIDSRVGKRQLRVWQREALNAGWTPRLNTAEGRSV